MQIGTLLWHPCSMDIIPHKIIGIREYEDHTIYESQAQGSVGACGKVTVLLTVDSQDIIRFMSLSQHYEHESGLQDFVDGIYYTNHNQARLSYNEAQRTLVRSKMEEARRRYGDAKYTYDKVCKIIDSLKAELRDQQ